MTWVSFALALLKFVNSIITWARERELISEGYQQAVAEQALAIAAKVQTLDQIREKVDAMSDDEVDQALRDLVPPAADGTKKL